DSSGRVGPAVLRGHIYFAGHYSQCASVGVPIEGRTRPFRAAYFMYTYFCIYRKPQRCVNLVEEGIDFVPAYSIGRCLPASCTSEELANVFRPAAVIPNPVCGVLKTDDTIPSRGAGFYITVSIMAAIAVVCIVAGIVDFFFNEKAEKRGITQYLSWRLFMAFSLYSNVASIFDVSAAAKSGQIGPIHCIRFFSFCWVVMGHFFMNYMSIAVNPVDISEMSKDILSEFIMTGYFAVDSFFFISGLLLTFLWLKSYKKNPGRTNSILSWIMFYVHRILRLTPAYYMAVFFYTFVYKQLFVGFPMNINMLFSLDYCRSVRQTQRAFENRSINKLLQCLAVSWYLASETQMFLFTPLLLLPLALKPIVGVCIAVLAIVASTAVNIALVYHYHWPTSPIVLFAPDPEMTNFGDYNMLMYFSPVTRCQIYIMGMLVGWLLQTQKRLRINWLVNIVGWVVASSLMLAVTLGLHNQTNGYAIPLFWRAMYSSLSRLAWGLGLAWIIVSSYYGYGG
ncbi:hypothetical protein PFISCL1PPCAC_13232, partial [Pristionchus fissidentatus]